MAAGGLASSKSNRWSSFRKTELDHWQTCTSTDILERSKQMMSFYKILYQEATFALECLYA